jgi:hypothetical protein
LISESPEFNNTFTAVIPESDFDFQINRIVGDDIAWETDLEFTASFALQLGSHQLKVHTSPLRQSPYVGLKQFGDPSVPVYELGEACNNENGIYDIRCLQGHIKNATNRYELRCAGAPLELIGEDLQHFDFSGDYPYYDKCMNWAAGYKLLIEYDTDSSWPHNGGSRKLRFAVLDERRRGYVSIFYGRKDVHDLNDDPCRDLMDPAHERGSVGVKAYHGVLDPDPARPDKIQAYMFWQYGQTWGLDVDGTYSGPGTVFYVGTALAVAGGIANCWNPVGWGLLTYASLGVAVGDEIMKWHQDSQSDEWGLVRGYGILKVVSPEGETRNPSEIPYANDGSMREISGQVFPSKRESFHTHEIRSDWAKSSVKPYALPVDINTQNTRLDVQVGDQVITHLSGTVEAGSPGGIGWHALLPYDWELDVSLTCDLSEDPTIVIWE